MHDDVFAVLRLSDVDLDDFDAEANGAQHTLDGVLGVDDLSTLHPSAAVRNDHHVVAPEVGMLEALEYLTGPGALGPHRRGEPCQCGGKSGAKGIHPHANRSTMTKGDARGLEPQHDTAMKRDDRWMTPPSPRRNKGVAFPGRISNKVRSADDRGDGTCHRHRSTTPSWRARRLAPRATPPTPGLCLSCAGNITKDVTGADAVVWGIPFDAAVSNRPGARFGPQAIRRASAIFDNDPQYPFSRDLFEAMSVVDYGDCLLD